VKLPMGPPPATPTQAIEPAETFGFLYSRACKTCRWNEVEHQDRIRP
jgi:hypothetical protein